MPYEMIPFPVSIQDKNYRYLPLGIYSDFCYIQWFFIKIGHGSYNLTIIVFIVGSMNRHSLRVEAFFNFFYYFYYYGITD